MLNQQWLQQAPQGYWLFKDGQLALVEVQQLKQVITILAVAGFSHKKTKHSKHGHRFLFSVEILTYKWEPKPLHFSE